MVAPVRAARTVEMERAALVEPYPLAYFTYAIARGASDGRYPYPFMDVGKIGAVQTALNAAAIAAAFVIAGFGLHGSTGDLLGRRRASL